jgi:hypothetical protein
VSKNKNNRDHDPGCLRAPIHVGDRLDEMTCAACLTRIAEYGAAAEKRRPDLALVSSVHVLGVVGPGSCTCVRSTAE